MYPARPEHTALQETWNYEPFLKYAELAAKDGMPFALGFGGSGNTDGIDQWGAMFHAFGADLVDRTGTVKVDSPEMQACLDYALKLVKFLPDEGGSYDDASNNRALIAGKTALYSMLLLHGISPSETLQQLDKTAGLSVLRRVRVAASYRRKPSSGAFGISTPINLRPRISWRT